MTSDTPSQPLRAQIEQHEPGRYEIGIQGHLDERWSAWFDGMTITAGLGGTTLLRGQVLDQAALHGVLARLRDLGLTLVSVVRVRESDDAQDSAVEACGE